MPGVHARLSASSSEQWARLDLFGGAYLAEVSDQGDVRRADGKGLKPRTDRDGYKLVDLGPRGNRRTCKVHRLVLLAFVGPSDLEVDHINRVRADNRLCNLRYATLLQNRNRPTVRKTSASGIRNVRYRKDKECWQAYCRAAGKFKSLGHFPTMADAARKVEEHERTC